MRNVNDTPYQRLSEVLGYDTVLSDALEAYSKASEGSVERARILDAYTDWLTECEHWQNLCFVDITFFTQSQRTVREALTIVITPALGEDGEQNHKEYVRALQDDYLANGHTMAPHVVFSAGIPVSGTQDDGPETTKDLREFFSQRRGGPMESRILLSDLGRRDLSEASPESAPTRPASQKLFARELKTYEKVRFTNQFTRDISSKPLHEQWLSWCAVFQAERSKGVLRSWSTRPIQWLTALPVGFRTHQPPYYEYVAAIFLALDDTRTKKDVYATLRFILLNLYEANATQMAIRHGVARGKTALLVPAAHELKYTTEAIPIPSLRQYFELLLNPAGKGRDSSKPETFDLDTLIREQLRQAARVERIIELAQQGSVRSSPNETIEAKLENFVKRVEEATTIKIGGGSIYTCPAGHRYCFELAVLAAFRNSIRHAWRRSEPGMSVTIEGNSPAPELYVEDWFIADSFQPVDDASGGGTGEAIKKYVEEFGMDSRSVTVKRISKGVVNERSGLFWERWQTIIPLPESEPG